MSTARNSMIARTRAPGLEATPGWAQRREAFGASRAAQLALGEAKAFVDALSEERVDAREAAAAAEKLARASGTVSSLLADIERRLSERDGAVSEIADLRAKLDKATEHLEQVMSAERAAKPAKPARGSTAERAELKKMEHNDARPTRPGGPKPYVNTPARAAMVLNRNK
jgi:ABC-type transporter Mla subunit MlaD